MAYVPPHKRNLKGKGPLSPTPVPDSLVPHFSKILTSREDTLYTWFGVDDNGKCSPHFHLKPISPEYELTAGKTPFVLVNNDPAKDDYSSSSNSSCRKQPWEYIAARVHEDLLSSYEVLRNKMKKHGSEKIWPALIVRLGKYIFYDLLEKVSAENNPVEEAALRQMRYFIDTSLPSPYIKEFVDVVVHKIGLVFQEEKELYRVWLSDKRKGDLILGCKCRVDEDNKLLFYKVEQSRGRQFVAGVSCLDKNLDLRLMLCRDSINATLTDDEMNSIKDFISIAVIDPDVKGGLRWPMEGTSFDQRFIAHKLTYSMTKNYKSSSLKLKIRQVYRIFFESGYEEDANEAFLKLNPLNSKLQDENFDEKSAYNLLEENLKLIWENFLCC